MRRKRQPISGPINISSLDLLKELSSHMTWRAIVWEKLLPDYKLEIKKGRDRKDVVVYDKETVVITPPSRYNRRVSCVVINRMTEPIETLVTSGKPPTDGEVITRIGNLTIFVTPSSISSVAEWRFERAEYSQSLGMFERAILLMASRATSLQIANLEKHWDKFQKCKALALGTPYEGEAGTAANRSAKLARAILDSQKGEQR